MARVLDPMDNSNNHFHIALLFPPDSIHKGDHIQNKPRNRLPGALHIPNNLAGIMEMLFQVILRFLFRLGISLMT
jgi:hypothetical protein